MDTRIKIFIVHNLEHYENGWENDSLSRYLSNEEQYTFHICVEDVESGRTIACLLNPVCPLGDDKRFGTTIYRTRQEMEVALFEEFNEKFSKYGFFTDAEIVKEEREFGKEAA